MHPDINSFDEAGIRIKLEKEELVKRIIYFDELASTNKYAKENNLQSDTLVITPKQNSGRGRFSRAWISAPGKDLTFTLVKNFKLRIDEIHSVNFYTSYILFKTLNSFFQSNDEINFSLKWPNDILLNGKKVAGILSEVSGLKSDIKKIIIGTGVNVNSYNFPEDIEYRSTSLYNESKKEIRPEKILVKFILNFYKEIDLIYRKDKLMKKWMQHSYISGKEIMFRKSDDEFNTEAFVVRIDEDGSILLKLKNGDVKRYYSGEITIKTQDAKRPS